MKQVLSILILLLLDTASSLVDQQPILLSSSFQGKWRVYHQDEKQDYLPIPKLYEKQGDAAIYFTDLSKKADRIQGVQIWLLMPKYYDQRVLKILIQFQQVNKNNKSVQFWQGKKYHKYYFYQNTALADTGTVNLSYFIDQNLIILQFDQKLSVIVTFKPKFVSPNTSFFFAMFAFFIFLTVRRKDKVQDTHIAHQGTPIILSVLLTFLISITEFIIGLRSLFGVMSPQAFFTVSGILNLAVCYHVVRFYWTLIIRRRIYIFILWMMACVYIWILLFLRHNEIYLSINSLVLLPEIGYHCLKGKKIQRDLRFIVYVVSCQLYVIYFKACPNNIFRQSPSYLISYMIPSLLIVQVGLLIGQIQFGSRFFIPSFMLPSQYDYYDRKNVKQIQKSIIQCHICLQQIKINKPGKRKIMVTPCKHIFHADCLQNWMLVQMKCPVDRSELPAL